MHNQQSAKQLLNDRFLYSLLIISLIIALIETLVMLILNFYQDNIAGLDRFEENAMDAFLLALVSSPLLWFVVLRPLVVRITRQQETTAEQARLNAELRAALDTHALISIADTQGRMVYANDKFCQVSGYSLEELMGKDPGYVQIQRDISAQVARESLDKMEQEDTRARLAIADALQQGIPLKERFILTLDILFELKSMYLQHKGGIFLRADDEDWLDMFVLHGTFTKEFIEKEKRIALGSCLCGSAAVSGELLVSDDCFCDPRHEQKFTNMQAHGHYIVPIIVAGDALGVLFLYTDPYPVKNERRLAMLKQVGEMLALAVLQEQAKVLLENSRDMAMQAALAKSEFLANMSHEIRTPMNGVLGMLDLLRDTNMSHSQWDLVETAYSSAEALLAILNDILDFSKLEAGKVEVEQIDLNLTALIEDVCSLFAGRAHTKGLELNCFMPVDMPRRWKGDPNRIRQVLTNLIGNAVKFTEHGEISVTVKYTPGIEGSDNFRFEVHDTGVGIAPEEQTKLFQPFSQAESNTARRFGGTGLGLSISKNLVVLMGGTIGLESVPGLGACFWFTLPLILSETEEVCVPHLDITGKRVLVVDDNATNRTFLQHYLIHWGFVVGQVDSGRDALVELESAIAKGTPYDLTLLDMHMPEMDGLTLARIITETPALTGIPRILLSSGGLVGDAERQALGFTQSLQKPVRQSQLFNAIANALQSSELVAPDNARTETPTPSYQGKKLLVVEDNKVNQKVITGMLAKFLLTPEIADNGQLALDKLAQSTYDLILMDCQMPVLDGYQATRELRRQEIERGTARQAVVALTAHAAAGEREKCLAAGMDDYLTKPVTRNSLAEILARWLGAEATEPGQSPALESSTADTAPVWDKAAALKGLEGDEGLLDDMIVSFLAEMPKQLCDIQVAQEQGDLPALANAAHAIKGSVSYFYAEGVRDYAARLEQAARSKQSANYRQMAEVLVNAVKHLMENIQVKNKAP